VNSTVIIHGVKVSDLSPRHGRPECDLWGVTRCNVKYWGGKLDDWTAWHEYHPLVGSRQCEQLSTRRPDNWEWMCRQDGSRPIYLHDPKLAHHPARAKEFFDMVPGATVFPLEDVREAFPVNGEQNRHFDCQLGLMMAFALYLGYERIILNGIGTRGAEMIMATHITTLYWIGFARGAGVDVIVEGPSIYQQPAKIYIFDDLAYPWAHGRHVIQGEDERQRRDRLRGRPVRR
jgi:hypothetical protein